MPSAILMPALSPTMTQGHVVTWHKKINDSVSVGDLLLDIETDKAVMEFESPQSGIIDQIVIPGGTRDVPVGMAVAIVRTAQEPEGAGQELALQWQAKFSAPSAATLTSSAPAAAPSTSQAKSGDEVAVSAAQSVAESLHTPLQSPVAKQPQSAPPPSAYAKPDSQPLGGRIVSSPLARQWAQHHGISLDAIAGTGPRGRIVKDDVVQAIQDRSITEHAERMGSRNEISHPQETPSDVSLTTSIPLTGMRRTIAQRLTLSKQTIPHFALTVSCDMQALFTMRQQLNQEFKSISVNDLLVRACAMALDCVQGMRVMWVDEKESVLVHSVDLAVAVSIEGGLITPIIRQAQTKTVRTISTEMKQLIEQARLGKLLPNQYQGGVFTLTNLGMMGIEEFTPIINPPHTGILAIGATRMIPVVTSQGDIVTSQVMKATVVADHRTVDGSVAAEFLTRFQSLVQNPWSLMS